MGRAVHCVWALLAALASAGCYDLSLTGFQQPVVEEEVSVRWARQISGPGDASAVLDVFPTGPIVMAGTFAGEATFGEDSSGQLQMRDAGDGADGYAALYGPGGELAWVVRLPASAGVTIDDVAILSDDFVVAGRIVDTLVVGQGGANEETLAGPGVFVARFEQSGELVWAFAEQGDWGNDDAVAMATTPQQVVVAMRLEGHARFGADDAPLEIALGPNESRTFVAAYDANDEEQLLWLKDIRGDAGAADVAVDDERVYLAGWFRGPTVFGLEEANEQELSTGGDRDVFVAALDLADGVLSWLERAGGDGEDGACAIGVVGGATLALAGTFDAAASFQEKDTSNVTSQDVFVARYKLKGAENPRIEWIHQGGGAETEGCSDLALQGGAITVVGMFHSDEAIFGEGEVATCLWSGGYQRGFVLRYDEAGELSWARWIGGTGYGDEVSSVAPLPRGELLVSGVFFEELSLGLDTEAEACLEKDGASDPNAFVMRLRSPPNGE